MKKIKNLCESDFLKLFFAFVTATCLIAALCMPDRSTMLSGVMQILTQPAKVSTNYFAVGGYAATFLNMGIVALLCLLLYVCLGATVNSVSNLAFILTLGFCSWGINVLNILPTMLGVVLYCLVKHEKLSAHVNTMLFSTGIAPLISELLLRYPGADVAGFRFGSVALALFVGLVIGFFLPAGLANSPKVHKGFDLYSAALPIGMTAFFLQAVLYTTMGVALPAAPSADGLKIASPLIVNTFCCTVFGLCIVFALLLGCRPRDYWKLLSAKDSVSDFTAKYGNSVFLMNVGVFGLFIVAYYNLIGASFNGVTFGIMICMLATCGSGSHPGNVWPIMAGYALMALLFGWFSGIAGGEFKNVINAQAIVIGLCYANGLSPISDKYGWAVGILAGALHYVLVTSVPAMHGGFCLYNGGFTAALICLLLVPQLERFLKTRQERAEAKV